MISSPMPMAMLLLLTAKGTDGFTITVGDKLPLYQLLLIIGTAINTMYNYRIEHTSSCKELV